MHKKLACVSKKKCNNRSILFSKHSMTFYLINYLKLEDNVIRMCTILNRSRYPSYYKMSEGKLNTLNPQY